jgi:hypothetical protein
MNPARTFASALVYWDFTGMWIAILTIMLGAVASGFAYKAAFGIEVDPEEQKEERASYYV